MSTLNITLPGDLAEFVEEQVLGGAFSSAEEYVVYLVASARERLKPTQNLKNRLLEGLDSGQPTEVTKDWWDKKRARLIIQSESGRP
ncbi:MAG: type II toxin-antitoxin system ParD family antitoxin [Acidobacteriota bacterium]|nr:type II toxin-antitoxin system ParD family antitoxin [Acidobacteriota bacterium]